MEKLHRRWTTQTDVTPDPVCFPTYPRSTWFSWCHTWPWPPGFSERPPFQRGPTLLHHTERALSWQERLKRGAKQIPGVGFWAAQWLLRGENRCCHRNGSASPGPPGTAHPVTRVPQPTAAPHQRLLVRPQKYPKYEPLALLQNFSKLILLLPAGKYSITQAQLKLALCFLTKQNPQ